MQVFVPEHRRAEILVEVGRMEQRQAKQVDSSSLPSDLDKSSMEGGSKQQPLEGSGPGLVSKNHCPSNADREASKLVAPEDKAEHSQGRALEGMNAFAGGKSEARMENSSNSVEAAGYERSRLDRTVEGKLESEFQRLPSSLTEVSTESRQGLSASQEQEDILEAWRKKRRQEFAALEGGSPGGDFHKRGSEADSKHTPGFKGRQNLDQRSQALDVPGKEGKGTQEKGARWLGSDEEDEELFKRLRNRLGVESADPGSLSSPLSTSAPPATPFFHKRDPPLVAPTTPTPQNSASPIFQPSLAQEKLSNRHTFPQSPRGEPARQSPAGDYSHPLRFTSNTPPVSPRRSLSPAASNGKRSTSEPATSRMHPAFSPPNSESSPSRPASPSSSESSHRSLKRANSVDSSPPETPTSARGLVFEPPARSSGLLTPEDEALLAAMSIVGRSRSRGSPASRRLPRGNSGLPPQHVPPSLLRRAVSIDPRVEARAVEQRAAERSRGVGEKAKIGDRLEREGGKGSPVRPGGESVFRGFPATEPQSGEGREAGSDKRLKRAEGESAGSAAAAASAWGETNPQGISIPGLERPGSRIQDPDESSAAAEETSGSGGGPGGDCRDATGARPEQGVGPHSEASAVRPLDAYGAEVPGRVKGVNRGLMLQILGLDDEDDLEGFGRFLSPVRTKVSDKSQLAKKRSNSFSEFTTVPSPPKVPLRMGGGFDREEWSPSRGRKGFGFAGVNRPRKQAPMQPAVANLIAETVEDFWSSDLMGAWGMGQGDTETGDEEPGSAPGGSAAQSGEMSADDVGMIVGHRRTISEGSAIMPRGILEDPGQASPGGLPPVLFGQARETNGGCSDETGRTTAEAEKPERARGLDEPGQHGRNDATSASDAHRRLERVDEEPAVKPPHSALRFDSLVVSPVFAQPARSDEQASATDDFPADVRDGNPVHKSSSRVDGSVGKDPQDTDSSSVSGHRIEPVRSAGPRVGPPLMDDVFNDSADVTRLREEIQQREEAIRRIRDARDH